MKSLTCKQLGGACGYEIKAQSWDDAVQKMTAHVMAKHPDVAQKMKRMHEQDPRRWGREMKPKWDAAREI